MGLIIRHKVPGIAQLLRSGHLRDPAFPAPEDRQLRDSAFFLFAFGLESPKDGGFC